jgi:hypothetical protein
MKEVKWEEQAAFPFGEQERVSSEINLTRLILIARTTSQVNRKDYFEPKTK